MDNQQITRFFILKDKQGSGSFGEIYRVQQRHTQLELAIKIEPANRKNSTLFHEEEIGKFLMGRTTSLFVGIPNTYFCSKLGIQQIKKGKHNVLVMELLGPSLQELLLYCFGKFSLKTVLLLAYQMIRQIRYIHRCGVLHRDIKPENFVMGEGRKQHNVEFLEKNNYTFSYEDVKHIPYREGKNLTGTERYASINTHKGIEQSRRDDLESIGYVLIYFLKGSLPWQNSIDIMEAKMSTSIETLCEGLPENFAIYFNYVRNLQFDEKPQYDRILALFSNLWVENGFECDYIYDWTYVEQESPKQD